MRARRLLATAAIGLLAVGCASVPVGAPRGPILLASPGCGGPDRASGAADLAPEDTLPSEVNSFRLGSAYLELDWSRGRGATPVRLPS